MDTVVVGVCTAKRPQMLRRCLDSLAAQKVPDDVSPIVVVVDNESEPNNQAAIEDFATACPFPVRYVHEPRPGIAIARNKALETAESLGAAWIAFTDDDCQVAPDWLYWLLRAAEWYEADIVTGHRKFVYPEGTPAWLCRKELSRHEGQPVNTAPTHNVLISRRLFALEFDERLQYGEDNDFARRAGQIRFNESLTHASDADLSAQAVSCGTKIVRSLKPVVWEEMPSERTTIGYHVRLSYRYAVSSTHRDIRYKKLGRPVIKALSSTIIDMPLAVLKLGAVVFILPMGRERAKKRILKNGRKLAGAAGRLVGLFGHFGNPYKVIDGH